MSFLPRIRLPLLLVLLALAAGLQDAVQAQRSIPEPPLPGEDGPPDLAPFAPLIDDEAPPPGTTPEIDPVDVPELPPLDLPDVDLSGENDIPELPSVPGLIVPSDPFGNLPGTGIVPAPDKRSGPGQAIELSTSARAVWERNPRKARALSKAGKKPLLLLFANQGAPTRDLREDLLSDPAFNEFASQNLVVSLLYSSNSTSLEDKPREEALAGFKKHFKVHGCPCMILLDENGHEIERIRGYARYKEGNKIYSTAHVLMDRLQTAVKRCTERREAAERHTAELKRQGFRQWTSRAGTSLFAKLLDSNAEVVLLSDENGKRRQVYTSQLHIFDREWLRRKRAGNQPETAPNPAPAPLPRPEALTRLPAPPSPALGSQAP